MQTSMLSLIFPSFLLLFFFLGTLVRPRSSYFPCNIVTTLFISPKPLSSYIFLLCITDGTVRYTYFPYTFPVIHLPPLYLPQHTLISPIPSSAHLSPLKFSHQTVTSLTSLSLHLTSHFPVSPHSYLPHTTVITHLRPLDFFF